LTAKRHLNTVRCGHRHRDNSRGPRRDWYDYAMLALAFAVLLIGVLGLLR
jgi:hypothetical protein